MQGPGPGPGLSCLTSRGCCAGSGHQGMRGWGPVSAAGDTWGPGAQEAGPEHPEVTCIGDRGQQNAPHLPNPRDDGPSHFLGAQGQREVKHSCWLPGPPPHASPWAERWVEWHGRPSGGPAPSPLTSHVFNGAVQHEVEERVKAFQDPTGL